MRKINTRTTPIFIVIFCLLASLLFSFSVSAAEAGSIPNNTVYRLKNVGSGKYLNVHNHVDANGTNVYQWTADGSVEQRFLFSYISGNSYRIHTMCSSNGTNRCLSIVKSSGSVLNGCNVQIYTPTDSSAQYFTVQSAGPQCVYLRSATNPNVVIGSYGNSNGSSTGTSATSAGNVFMQTFTGSSYQKWILEPYNATQTIVSGQYYIKSNFSNRYVTVNGVNVLQKAKTGANTQKWNVVYTGNGFYYLEPASNLGYRMDVANAADGDGVNVGIHPENGNDAQKYRIISCGNGSYRIAPASSATRVLDVCGPSTAENANIQIWNYENVSQQQWTFELISASDPYSALGWSWVFANNQHTRISSGYRTTSRPSHYGIDLSDSTINGATIYSPTAGVVQTKKANDADGGHMVVVKSNYTDSNGEKIRIAFLHMTSNSSTLNKDDSVSAGTRIGTVGSTGDSSGPHLHLSTYNGKNGNNSYDWPGANTSINPQRFFPNITFTGDLSNTRP